MKKLAKGICKSKYIILIITCILTVFSFIGMSLTKINYDILVYLPEEIETVKGEEILQNDFNMGAYTVVLTENLKSKDIIHLENKLKNIDGVNKVVSIYDLVGTNIPLDILPNDLINKLHKEDTDLLFVTFDDSISSTKTINAIEEMRSINPSDLRISGMSAMVLDTRNLSESEITIYIIIAVILCLIILELSLDSYLAPVFLLLNIGLSILFNFGTNIFLGEISYITKALVAVLQLGVTTDFSIFLYHAYEGQKKLNKNKEEAMQKAILETFTSVTGSSLTTIAGFLVLCTMNLTLGRDLGIVMAKGVFLGVISVLTIFPSFLLVFDKWIAKTKHKSFNLSFKKLNNLVVKYHKVFLIIFLVLFIPSYLANKKVDVYYKIDSSLPKTLDSIVANQELKDKFKIVSPEIILLNKNMKTDEINDLITDLKKIDGIDFVLSFSELESRGIHKDMLSSEVTNIFESDNYQMLFINSLYDIASDELNNQINLVNECLDKYDESGILAGEGPLMKDLVVTSDEDFKNVNYSSIICIAIIMFLVLKSISLPILLILVIEFAIFVNFSFSYFGGITLPFIAPIVLGTIQLGATIDYAILLTTTYLKERRNGIEKTQAMLNTLNYVDKSILVSGMCFFAATCGVGMISKLEMVASICNLLSRGAIISMIVVICILPSILLIFDSIILKTTYSKDKKEGNNMKKKIITSLLVISIGILPINIKALEKEETVYAKLNEEGSITSITVNEHLKNDKNVDILKDYTDLENIYNTNSNHTFTKDKYKLTWESKGSSIFYQGTTNKELPITEKISYSLDGKTVSLNELLGKKGHVVIKINYQNKLKNSRIINGKNTTLYTPFLITTGMVFDSNTNKNITINNGRVVDNGKESIVLGISSPGIYESINIDELKDFGYLTIKLDTEKFELPSIYSIATPKLIEESDLEIFDKMNELTDSMDELEENIEKIEDGSKELLNGLEKLNNGSQELSKNLSIVLDNLTKVNQGTGSLKEGISATISALENSLSELPDNDTLSAIKGMVENAGIDATLETTLVNLLEDYKEMNNKVNIMISTLKKLEKGAGSVYEGTTTLRNGVAILNEKTKEFTTGTKDLADGADELFEGIKDYNKKGIQELRKETDKIDDYSDKLHELLKISKNYKTFTYNKNQNASTKFIMVVDSVSVKEEEKEVEQVEVKKTFFDRVKDLFR